MPRVFRRGSRDCGLNPLHELQVTWINDRVGVFNRSCACLPLWLNTAASPPDRWTREAPRTMDRGHDSSRAEEPRRAGHADG